MPDDGPALRVVPFDTTDAESELVQARLVLDIALDFAEDRCDDQLALRLAGTAYLLEQIRDHVDAAYAGLYERTSA